MNDTNPLVPYDRTQVEVLDPEPEAAIEALVLNQPPESIMLKLPPSQLQPGDLIRMTKHATGSIRWQVLQSVSKPAEDGGEVQITFVRPNSEEGAAVLEANVMLEIARPLTVLQVPHAKDSKLRRWWQKITRKD